MKSEMHYATGRRKTSSARVYLTKGKGNITVNDRELDVYFGRKVAQMLVLQPLELTESVDKFDIKVMLAINPKILYLPNIKSTTKTKPIIKDNIPAFIES